MTPSPISRHPLLEKSGLRAAPIKAFQAVTTDIVGLQRKYVNSVCISCLFDIADKHNVGIAVTTYPEHTLVFEVRVFNSKIPALYKYTFVVLL